MIGKDIERLVGKVISDVHAHYIDGYDKGLTIDTKDGIHIDISPIAINENIARIKIVKNGRA